VNWANDPWALSRNKRSHVKLLDESIVLHLDDFVEIVRAGSHALFTVSRLHSTASDVSTERNGLVELLTMIELRASSCFWIAPPIDLRENQMSRKAANWTKKTRPEQRAQASTQLQAGSGLVCCALAEIN
jgi:hypothetical protein